jgi:RHS repeat-associated protein
VGLVEYAIDAAGRRTGKKVGGALLKGWLYDGAAIVAELDGAGNVVSRFFPGGMIKGGATYRILRDHLGSPRLVVDTATGAVAQRMDFDEFGRVLQDTNPGFTPFGFAGGHYDPDTGLVRFGARDYMADVGRWTAKDPIRFQGGDTNLYGYVFNDPVNLADPSGLKSCVLFTGRRISTIGDTSYYLGTHVALYVDGETTGKFLYDPAGGYAGKISQGSGDLLHSDVQGWSLEGFVDYHFKDGDDVDSYCFDTSSSDEEEMLRRAEEIAGVFGGMCSAVVSNTVSGLGPFPDPSILNWGPGWFHRRIANLSSKR